MKRPLCVMGLSFALSLRAAFSLERDLMLLLAIAAFLVGVLLMLAGKRQRFQAGVLALLCVAGGFAWCWLHITQKEAPFQALEGERVAFRGVVEDVTRYPGSTRYTIKADFPGRDLPGGQRVLARTYREAEYLPGELVEGEALLRPLEELSSYSSLRARGIRATGYLEELRRGDGFSRSYRLSAWVIGLREALKNNLYTTLSDGSASLVSSMVLGAGENISSRTYGRMVRSGSVHLLAVSGMHLSVFTAFVLAVLRRLRLPQRLQYLLAILSGFCFAVLVGFSASILRAFLMLAVLILGRMLSRKSDGLTSLGMALLVICALWPHWTMGWGIWLSCAATAGILILSSPVRDWLSAKLERDNPAWNRAAGAVCNVLGVGIGAYLFTAPLLLLRYGWISLVAPLTNLLIAPFAPVVVVGGMACAALGDKAAPAVWLTEWCARAVEGISGVLSGIPFATTSLDQPYQLLWLVFAAAAVAAAIRWRKQQGVIAYALALCVLTYGVGGLTHTAASRGRVELAAVSGCDAAVLLRQGQAVILGTPSQYEVERLLRYLQYRQVDRIAAVVAPDCGEQIGSGLLRLREEFPVECIIGPDDDYILGQLSLAMPEVSVASGGYADIRVLGSVQICMETAGEDLFLAGPGWRVLKTTGEYGIIEPDAYTAAVYPGGTVILPPGKAPDWSPVGTALYGESRVLLPLDYSKGGE